MNQLEQLLILAVQNHQLGELEVAESYYRQVLSIDSQQADALHLLGVLSGQRGDFVTAVEMIGRAITARPGDPAFHNNLGETYRRAGKSAEAIQSYRQALICNSSFYDAHINLGCLLLGEHRPIEALPHLQQAVRIAPHDPLAHFNLGSALVDLKRWEEAEGHFQYALQMRPNFAEAYYGLGNVLRSRKQYTAAAESFSRALHLAPDLADAHNGLGVVRFEENKTTEALGHFRRAYQLNSNSADICHNLGKSLHAAGEDEQALTMLRKALLVDPKSAEKWNSLGNALRDMGRFQEALTAYNTARAHDAENLDALVNIGSVYQDTGNFNAACDTYQQVLAKAPQHANAHAFLGIALLSAGRFEEGWPEYEWRSRTDQATVRVFRQPEWDGNAAVDKVLYVHAEQGMGDLLQFIRYAPLVRSQVGRLIVECHRPLIPLISGIHQIDEIVPLGENPPPFDVQAPLLSLPRIMGTTLHNIPANVPYLFAREDLLEKWQRELAHSDYLIGLAWQGNPEWIGDRRRSIPLEKFEPLTSVPGVRLVSLQKGNGIEQIAAARQRFPIIDLGESLDAAGAFLDTAAVMKSLDLVISIDSAVIHLAGALGVPAWLASQFAPDWRWQRGREDSPWYPSVRLFRQQSFGDWDDVIQRMADVLSSERKT